MKGFFKGTFVFWIWAFATLVYPLLVWPWVPNRVSVYFLKLTFGVLLLSLFGFWGLWRARHLSLGQILLWVGRAIKAHLPVRLALLYALWALLASFFSPLPALSLMGSSDDYQDGALAEALFVLLGIAAYLGGGQARKGIRVGLVGVGLFLSLMALLEVLLRRGLYYPVALRDLPLGVFPGKGHLAGFLLLSLPPSWPLLWPTLILGLGLGVTYTRAALGGLVLAWLGGFLRPVWAPKRHFFLGMGAAMAVLAGLYLGKLTAVAGGKDLGSPTTWETRLILWKTAWRALQQRPWTGFGGGVFYLYWTDYISRGDLARLLWLEDGLRVLDVRGRAILAERDGKKVLVRTNGWKAHNEFLDLALMWGFPGAGLFAWLFLLALIRGMRGGEVPLALGLLGYGAFLCLWYVPFEVKGILWPVMGALWATGRKL